MCSKKNESAKEFWTQVFSNLAKSEEAALQDPEYDHTEDDAKFSKALKDAGWSDEHIRQRIEFHHAEVAGAPVTSPGVNPFVESHLARLCDDVEAAMDRLKLGSHAKVARGVEPRAWPYASKINVIMTDQSVVTVSAFLFRFCGLVARAFTRTLMLNPYAWEASQFNERSIHGYLKGAPELLVYWMKIYLSYATTGTHILVPFKPARPSEVILFEQVARAMEIFSIAHEYGHHDLLHGKALESDPHKEEFQADQFSLRICYEVERLPLILENPYLSSGAGGVVLLLALETLRDFEKVIGFTRSGATDTHPDVTNRIGRFDSVAILRPREFAGLKNFRTVSERVMRVMHSLLIPTLKAMPPKVLQTISDLRSRLE